LLDSEYGESRAILSAPRRIDHTIGAILPQCLKIIGHLARISSPQITLRTSEKVAAVTPRGGGSTVANPVHGGQAPAEVLSGEIEAALRSLAGKLQNLMHEPAQHGTGALGGDIVLFDVKIGEVRLLALRQGQPSPMSLLSPREQEIARMVAQGYPNKTIASVLEISSWTVASHLRRIFVKLQISSRAAMATCLLGSEFNGLPTLLDNVSDEDITSDPRSSRETGLRAVSTG
jgi:DNA-binding CsgD family transcriptional regulator